jgi:dolichyl-diphosphooligosaccharide--protein glycosyltransferase
VSEQTPVQKRRLHPEAIAGIILAVLCGISLYIRIYLPYDQIFVNGQVWLRETDAYYYLRHIENLIHNFPRFNPFDPYHLYPGGGMGLLRPMFAWIVAAIILLIGGGEASPLLIQTVAAYMPAILGTLTLIPVYFIGKVLFSRWVGIIAAGLLVIMPGEFLHRSLLGFTDHHVAEVLFSTSCILLLIMAIKRARQKEITFGHILSRDWKTIRSTLIYTLLAGIFFGFYLLSWIGALLFILVIFAYLVIQFIVDHLRRKSTDYLCIIGTPVFLVAFLMLLPVLGTDGLDIIYGVSISVAIAVPMALSVISRFMASKAWKPVFYPLTMTGLAGIGLVILHAVNPSLFQSMLGLFIIFRPGGAILTVMEVAPLLFPQGTFSFDMAWANFNASFFIAFISIGMLIYVIAKGKSADKTLFLVWSVMMLLAVLGQRRFAYYYAVNAALLTGYFSWKMLDIAGLRKLAAKPKEVVGAVKKFKKRVKRTAEKAKRRTFMQPRGAWVRVIVVGIILFVVVFLPSIPSARGMAGAPNFIMNEGWQTSMLWLRNNSPEPFGDPNFYYALYGPGDEFEFPETAYGVMSWWDYGYFIMQIGRRIPNANPTQSGAREAGQFFTAQNETAANELADRLGTRYVVIGHMMPTAKFHAKPTWAGSSPAEFFGIYHVPGQAGGQWAMLYYPAYYQSIVARLYNFGGRAVVPAANSTIVISYEQREQAGQMYNVVTWGQTFPTYEAAQTFIANQTARNYKIVGGDPFNSPVPLEALNSYVLIHQSEAMVEMFGRILPMVKIFEYLGSNQS